MLVRPFGRGRRPYCEACELVLSLVRGSRGSHCVAMSTNPSIRII